MHGSWLQTVRSADLWEILGLYIRSQLPRQLDVSHPTTAAIRALCPLPHHICRSLLWREDLRAHWGERQRLCPSWDMAAGCGELEWQGMLQTPLGLFCETMTLLSQRRKRHKPNSSGISIHKSILRLTQHRPTSHDRPDRFWYRRSQKCVLRFSAYATTVTHLLSLQDDRDNLASPEQTSGITSMMHTFIGIIIFLNYDSNWRISKAKKKELGRGMKPIPYKWWFVTHSPNWHLNMEQSLMQNLADTWIPVIWLIRSHEWE